jgi:hypothetical protein
VLTETEQSLRAPNLLRAGMARAGARIVAGRVGGTRAADVIILRYLELEQSAIG